MDWSNQRTDKPLRVELKAANGEVALDADGKPSVLWVWSSGSKAKRAAAAVESEINAEIEANDKLNAVAKAHARQSAAIDAQMSLINKAENLEFDGNDCAKRATMRAALEAVPMIGVQVSIAARIPNDFLPGAPASSKAT